MDYKTNLHAHPTSPHLLLPGFVKLMKEFGTTRQAGHRERTGERKGLCFCLSLLSLLRQPDCVQIWVWRICPRISGCVYLSLS